MREQLQLDGLAAELLDEMRGAWRTANDFEAALCTKPSQPEIYEMRLLLQIRRLYVGFAFTFEALQLPTLLAEFKAGFAKFKRAQSIAMELDEFGNLYPSALEYFSAFLSPITAASSSSIGAPDDLPRLERILIGTARLVKDRLIEPRNECEVRNALYQTLIHVFPDTVREVPIAKVSKCYRPDIGIRSLRAAVEFKFADSEDELKRAIGGVYEDVAGYAGSEDWKHFYAVFYMTDAFMTQSQVEAEFSLSKVDRKWRPLLVQGRGGRQIRMRSHKEFQPSTARRKHHSRGS